MGVILGVVEPVFKTMVLWTWPGCNIQRRHRVAACQFECTEWQKAARSTPLQKSTMAHGLGDIGYKDWEVWF